MVYGNRNSDTVCGVVWVFEPMHTAAQAIDHEQQQRIKKAAGVRAGVMHG